MLRLPLKFIRPGMTVARDIFHANGSMLLAHNTILGQQHVERLARLGIAAVYIKNPYFNLEPPSEILREKTRHAALALTRSTFENFQKTKTINLAKFHNLVDSIVNEVVANKHALIHLTDIRTYDDHTFSHSLNVCLLSVMVGVKLHYSPQRLRELALGGLLHDVGKMLIPVEILNKPGPLDSSEWSVMQQHTDGGFQLLRSKQDAIPLLAAHIAYQHHENFDGSGYGRQLAGDDIHEYARIAAIADIFDALTADRPYRTALLPHEAYEVITASRGSRLDPHLTDLFLESVAIYPPGAIVQLNTGEICMVIRVIPQLQTRPILKVILDEPGGTISAFRDRTIDLTQETTKLVAKVLAGDEILVLGGFTQA